MRDILGADSSPPPCTQSSCTLSATERPSRTPYSSLTKCAANPGEPAASGNDSTRTTFSTLPRSPDATFITLVSHSSVNVHTSPSTPLMTKNCFFAPRASSALKHFAPTTHAPSGDPVAPSHNRTSPSAPTHITTSTSCLSRSRARYHHNALTGLGPRLANTRIAGDAAASRTNSKIGTTYTPPAVVQHAKYSPDDACAMAIIFAREPSYHGAVRTAFDARPSRAATKFSNCAFASPFALDPARDDPLALVAIENPS
mmetsp:Transcript_3007/g.10121  ORF Transcript_3007/g.10121 Transcript_3007/m.10121 type:complete len:257 (-) Transcript_3007:402-1172(-)